MTTFLSAVFWLCTYLALVLAPVFVLLIGPVPSGSGFWWDFSMALGFTGMAMMGVQFLLTARFQHASAPFGIDVIYFFHRYLALIAISLIFVHYLIIRINYTEALATINPLQAPWYMTAGRTSLVLLTILIITSLWRKRLRIHYEEWRMLHIALAVMAFLLALNHIDGVSYYIDAPAKRWLWTGYILFWLVLIVYVRLIKPWKMRSKPYRVVEVRLECCNSWTLALEPEGHDGISFKPGQFAWLTLRASPYHIKEHPFSFSSSAAIQDRVEFTIKELGDFTSTIKQTKVGEIAYLDGPYGVFSIDRYPNASAFAFVAGGIGIAPIISMLRTLADRNEQRSLLLIYSNNRWDDVIFNKELEALKQRLDLRIVHVLKDPPTSWTGESGFITPALLKKVLSNDARMYEYFLCGPKPMSDVVQQGLFEIHVPMSQVHFELFDLV